MNMNWKEAMRILQSIDPNGIWEDTAESSENAEEVLMSISDWLIDDPGNRQLIKVCEYLLTLIA